MKRLIAISLILLAASTARSDDSFGSFGVDRRARLSFSESGVGFVYTVTMSESPAAEEIRIADANGDGVVDETEKKIFVIRLATRVRDGFRISIDRAPADVKLASANGDIIEKTDGRKIVKAEMLFNISLPSGWNGGYVTIDDAVFPDKVGTRELIVDPSPGWEISTMDGVPKEGYYLFTGPKGSGPWSSRFEITRGKKAPQPESAAQPSTPAPVPQGGVSAASDIFGRSSVALFFLILAVAVGIGHAIMPSHGASLVSAYLVGPHNTIRHAALLGWVVTAIRTTPVFAIGVALLALDRYLLPDKYVGTLRILCAISVAIAGLVIVVWHKLSKPTKEPPVPIGVSTSEVVALGVAGSFVPSPSAMALLFTAASVGQAPLGLGMVVAFGVGLELTMTMAGFLRLASPSTADRLEDAAEKSRGLRLIWGLIILAVGLASAILVRGR